MLLKKSRSNEENFSSFPASRAEDGRLIQRKLTIGAENDPLEHEADSIADKVMRLPETSVLQRRRAESQVEQKVQRKPLSSFIQKKGNEAGMAVNDHVVSHIQSSKGNGNPIPESTRSFMESRFGADFSGVRIHNSETDARLSDHLNAKAFTVANDIYFNSGKYSPDSESGKRLLAHELTHTIQQDKTNNKRIQRDLSAYNSTKQEYIPDYSGYGGSTTFIDYSAEGPALRMALSGLIKADKIKEVLSTDGKKSWFSANHHKNAQLAEIESALSTAGYTDARKIAKAIYDIHTEYLYTNREIGAITMFGSQTISSKKGNIRQTSRSMTEHEIRQAKRVFKNAINYPKVTIEENSNILAVGGYARTVGNTINFPDDSYRSMSLMIHELTHVWQYQTTGWTYAPKALIAQITEGYSYTATGKTTDQSLIDDRAAGKTLYSFNKEQQGDILRDYFIRLQSSSDVSAFQPFIDDIK